MIHFQQFLKHDWILGPHWSIKHTHYQDFGIVFCIVNCVNWLSGNCIYAEIVCLNIMRKFWSNGKWFWLRSLGQRIVEIKIQFNWKLYFKICFTWKQFWELIITGQGRVLKVLQEGFRPENTVCRWKYVCMDGLQFDWIRFSITTYFLVWSNPTQ